MTVETNSMLHLQVDHKLYANKQPPKNSFMNLDASTSSYDHDTVHPRRAPQTKGLQRYWTTSVFIVTFTLSITIVCLLIPISWLLTRTPLARLIPANAVHKLRSTGKKMMSLYFLFLNRVLTNTPMHITAEGMELDTLVSSNGSVIQYGDIKLPKRYVIVANHQLSNDFMFLWLLSYYGKRVGGMMGLLLDNLKHMLEFFDFVFMHRNWKHDGSRLMTRVRKLATGWEREEELAFFVFPEGALLTDKWREKMQQFAMKNNITRLPERTLLPHVTGLYTVLDNLRDSNVDYLYDVTIAYEGLYSHETPSEVYSIARQYWYRGYPKGVHLRVRRWHIPTEVPIDAGQEVFGQWLMDRWLEKDAMLKRFYATGSMALGATPEERQAETVICPSHPRSYLVESMPFVALVALYGAVCWGLWNALLMLF